MPSFGVSEDINSVLIYKKINKFKRKKKPEWWRLANI
jgi:hypothetical protein